MGPEPLKVLISTLEESTAKNGSKYYRIQITNNKKESMNVVYFDPPKRDILGKVCEVVLEKPKQPGHKPQIKNLRVLDKEDVSEYIKTTSINVIEAMEWFKNKTRDLGDLTKIIDSIVFSRPNLVDRFMEWPAAKSNHHAFKGGLIEHTWAMGKAAEFAMSSDPSCQGLNEGIVYSAVLLHDFAKIVEYDWSPPGPAKMTVHGLLLGHITMMDELVTKTCMSLGIQTRKGDVLHLRHCILSHHGRKEFGSPVTPGTREALLLHRLDMFQSRSQMALEAMAMLEPGANMSSATLQTILVNIPKEEDEGRK